MFFLASWTVSQSLLWAYKTQCESYLLLATRRLYILDGIFLLAFHTAKI